MAEILSVKTEKFEMEYAKFGDGPKTFIIIPGLSLKNVLNSASSVEVGYKIFKQDYTCYLFDRIKNPPEVYPISQMAEDLAETLKVLGIKDADVFGSSQGGMVAQYMAINHPELIRKLVLGSSSSRAEPRQLECIGGWTDMAIEGRAEELVNSFIDNCFSKEFVDRWRKVLLKMNSGVTPEEMHRFSIMSAACAGVDTYDDLGKIKCPVYVIAAGNDSVVTTVASEKIFAKLQAENVPSEFFMYGGLGHAAYDENHEYKQKILDFFNKA